MKMTLLLSWLVAILVPFALIGLGLRVLLTPLFLQVEYNMPYFPPDTYGFTKADRLKWAPYALEYLVNDADIWYLGDLKFDDGSPLYNERELSHMHDVKVMTKGALNVWYATLALLVGLGLWSRFGGWEQAYRQGLMRGGWLMVGLAAGRSICSREWQCPYSKPREEHIMPWLGSLTSKGLGVRHVQTQKRMVL